MPSSVLISDRPSAPAATQALATATMSVTSGDSLANTGMSYLALPRTAAITLPARCGSSANGCPASSALGQDRLTSMAVTPAVSDSRAASPAYSRMVWPAIETTTRAPRDSSQGRSRCRNASTPGPCRPTEFSSAARRLGQPRRGVAGMGFGHDRLADQRADPGHVDELGQLTARARAAGRGEHQVGQFGLAEPGPHVSRHAPPLSPHSAIPVQRAGSSRARRARRTGSCPCRPSGPGRRGTPGRPRRSGRSW